MPTWLSVCFSRERFKWPPGRLATVVRCSLFYLFNLSVLLLLTVGGWLRHRRLNVRYLLNNYVPSMIRYQLAVMLQRPVSFPQYRAFLRSIFRVLFPDSLIGASNLKIVVDSAAKNIFNLCRSEMIHFKRFYSGSLKSSKVKWLKHLESLLDRTIIFRAIVHWLLLFAVSLTKSTFYVSDQKQTNRLIFYRKDTWRRIEKHSFKILQWKRELQLVDSEEKVGPFRAYLRFVPKGYKARPLMIPPQCPSDRSYCKSALKKVNGLLDFICNMVRRTRGALPLTGAAILGTHDNFFRRFRRFARRNKSKKIYVVKTDIRECFDRINQHKLRQILTSLIDTNRLYVFTVAEFKQRKAAKKTVQRKKSKKNAKGKSWVPPLIELITKGGIFPSIGAQRIRMYIKGAEALQILEKGVIQQKVIFGGRCYVANRGIPQGSSVSVRLCNLYLGAMERERYANLINNKDTLLFRYVDDYVLLTTEFSVANHFLRDLLCGVEDGYDVLADPSKTTVNFKTDLHELRCCLPMIGVDGCVSIDATRFNPKQRFSPSVKETARARAKRLAIMTYVKAVLQRRMEVLRTLTNGKWKVMAMRKLVRLGFSWYVRPYAKKIMLNPKGPMNRIFMRRLPAWVLQGFAYNYNYRMSRLFGM
uniref:Telomerase reverse transcriptase n=1 Tax=Ascaris lumbricoides TaxID=6252 RepID=A0A9J2PHM0_ASCLU